MSRIIRGLVPTLAVAMLLALTCVPGATGGDKSDKSAGWKAFLPSDIYQDLVRRSLERIHALAKDPAAPGGGLRAEAVILAAYTISTKDSATSALLRQKAVKIATLAAEKESADEARKLASDLTTAKGDTKGTAPAIDWPAVIGDIDDLMAPLANKARGGEGIPADLQYTAKLKSQNGTEALLVALATKQLSATNAGKFQKELELIGYRVATIGAVTRRRGPTKNKEEAKLWEEQAIIMRDGGIELAEASRKKDVTLILAASKRLVSGCAECHANFKK
jgi:hypothetical protein